MVEHLSSEQKVVGSSPIRSESCMSAWSSGMIPALGAGGPGFKSRSGPIFISFGPKDSLTESCREGLAINPRLHRVLQPSLGEVVLS